MDNLNNRRFDVIEINSKRIDINKYKNVAIVIDLHTYDRFKVEYMTRSSMFEISNEQIGNCYYNGFREVEFIKNAKMSLAQNQSFIMDENGSFITITNLDGKITLDDIKS